MYKIRKRISTVCEAKKPFKGEIAIGESYFGARSVKGKKGRGAFGKMIVFGILNSLQKSVKKAYLKKDDSEVYEMRDRCLEEPSNAKNFGENSKIALCSSISTKKTFATSLLSKVMRPLHNHFSNLALCEK